MTVAMSCERGPAEIRFHAREIFGQGEVDKQLAEIGRLELEGAPKRMIDSVPFTRSVKGKYQQQQKNAKRIAQISRCGKEFAIGQQDKGANDTGDDKEEQSDGYNPFSAR